MTTYLEDWVFFAPCQTPNQESLKFMYHTLSRYDMIHGISWDPFQSYSGSLERSHPKSCRRRPWGGGLVELDMKTTGDIGKFALNPTVDVDRFPSSFALNSWFLSANLLVSIRPKVHPYFQQTELLELCRQKNLQIQAFSPFAHGELGLLDDRLLLLGLVGNPWCLWDDDRCWVCKGDGFCMVKCGAFQLNIFGDGVVKPGPWLFLTMEGSG